MSQRKALGKGLSALIPNQPPPGSRRRAAAVPADAEEGEEFSAIAEGAVLRVPIGHVNPNPDQPRKKFDKEALAQLSESIADRGVIQPILVTRAEDGEGYTIIAGERRWRASRQAGLTEVPVVVREAVGAEILELALIENIQRQDLDPLDEALAYKNLINDYGYTQEELAQRMAVSRSAIANSLRLLNLSPEVKDLVAAGALTAGHARALLSLDHEGQVTAARTILARGLNVRDAENLVKQQRAPKPSATKSRRAAKASAQTRTLSEELQRTLGTKVTIVDKGKRGQIHIDFYSYEDLDRIIEHINNAGRSTKSRGR